MKLRPANTPRTHCVRCNAAFNETVGQVRATCSPCATALALLHKQQEYTMYRRTYYLCSTEGTSYQWLIDNGYSKEVTLSYALPRSAPMVQVPLDFVAPARNNVRDQIGEPWRAPVLDG